MTRQKPTRVRETEKARREREAYEAHMARQQRLRDALAEQRLTDARSGSTLNPRTARPIVDERERQALEERRAPAASVTLPPEHALARTTDVETSHNAVPSRERRATQQASIMSLYRDHPNGLTADEVSVLLGDDLWRRVSDLRTNGYLAWKLVQHPNAPTGVLIPATRMARSGRQARVLVIKAEA